MRIVERPEIWGQMLAEVAANKPPYPPGFHQHDFNQCLRKTALFHFLQQFPETSTGLRLKFARGEAMGSWLNLGQEEDVFHAPGLGWCSIDKLWLDEAGNSVPLEIKTTDFSADSPIAEHVNYICQLATYVAKKARLTFGSIIPEGEYCGFLSVLFNHGNYKPTEGRGPRDPDGRAFTFFFGGAELLEWEAELERRVAAVNASLVSLRRWEDQQPGASLEAEKLRDWLPTETPREVLELLPSVQDHYPWECEEYSRCPLKDLIDCPGTAANAAWSLPFEITEQRLAREEKPMKGQKKGKIDA